MTSLYIRLAGPLQSWASLKVSGNIVRTQTTPTRSGLEGIVAACLGLPRGISPEWFKDLQFSVRVDNAGQIVDDYQTIGVRDEDREFASRIYALLSRKQVTKKDLAFIPDAQGKTTIINRTLLADAEFIVRIQCEGHLEEVDHAVRDPVFIPYLGRKAFSPSFPFYLGIGADHNLETLPWFDKSVLNNNEKAGAKNIEDPCVKTSAVLEVRHLSGLTTHSSWIPAPATVETREDWLKQVQNQLRRRA